MRELTVGVLMDLPPGHPYHDASLAALHHAADALGLATDVRAVRTTAIAPGLAGYAAVIIGPGSPYDDPEAVLTAIRTARERGIPLVGT